MYRPELDGMRAIAVLAVIAHHFNKDWLPNGYLGVDIFFVLSGFVITQSLMVREYHSFGDYIIGFYNRRVKRLVPALFLSVSATILIAFLVVSPESNSTHLVSSLSVNNVRTGIAALFGISNLYLIRQSTDYFGSSAELNAFTHTWSLGVEEQFYFIFPLLLWIICLSKKSEPRVKLFTWFIIILGAISLCLYFWFISFNFDLAFYLMLTRFWEFVIGSVTYLLISRSGELFTLPSYASNIISFSSLVVLFFTLFVHQSVVRAELNTVLVVVITAVIILMTRQSGMIGKALSIRPMVYIGLISYSLYLWHWPVLTFARWTMGVDATSIPYLFLAILVLSVLSYKFVERPLRYADWNFLKIGDFIINPIWHVIIIVIALSSTVMLVLTPLHNGGFLYAGKSAPLGANGGASISELQDYDGKIWELDKCAIRSNNEVGKVIFTQDCTFGDYYSADKRFLVVGNSFSTAQIEMFKIIPELNLGSVTITSVFGGSVALGVSNTSKWDKANYYYWVSVVPSLVENLRAGDTVIMVSDGTDLLPKEPNDESQRRLSQVRNGLENMSQQFLDKGITVLFQSSIPFIQDSDCTPNTAMKQWWHFSNEPPCLYYTRQETLERRSPYHDLLLEIQRDYTNFTVLDLMDVYCPEQICRFYNREGVFLYRDQWAHPSIESNILAQPLLVEAISRLGK